MRSLLLALFWALPARAADVVGAAPVTITTPFVLYSPLPAGLPWLEALRDPVFAGLRSRYGPAALDAILAETRLREPDAAGFAALAPLERARRLDDSIRRVEARARAEAYRLERLLVKTSPEAPEYPLLVAQAHTLSRELAPLLDEKDLLDVRSVYEDARLKLDGEQLKLFAAALERVAAALGSGRRLTLVDALAQDLPEVPAGAMTLPVLQARAERPKPPAPAVPKPGPALRLKLAAVNARWAAATFAARRVYRPLLRAFNSFCDHASEIWIVKIAKRRPTRHLFRWSVVKALHEQGDFSGSFGHDVYEGDATPQSPMIRPAEEELAALRRETLSIARDLLLPGFAVAPKAAFASPMLAISGMSYPQLSAQSHLSLLYIHLKLAKAGVRQLYNTGEGSPYLLLGLLNGDKDAIKAQIVSWNLEHKGFKDGGWKEAEVVAFVDRLMAERDRLLREFSPEDLKGAQIVAQFGSGLNGLRTPKGRVDFDRLRGFGESPFVAMTQFKIKQAAKRGAKLEAGKLGADAAAFRDLPLGATAKAPEITYDLSSYENIARLIVAAKIVTRKPVSIKYGVGDVKDAYRFLEYLRDAGALPDHIQVDGRGRGFSPGSGNAPPQANTSRPSREAVIILDAILRKLGVRKRVYLEATGDILLPDDGVEQLFLGADGIAGARVWMGMGLGCAMVRWCKSGDCPYGIASKNNTLVGLSLDPKVVAPKGLAAALNWFKTYTQDLAEAGVRSLAGFHDEWSRGEHDDHLTVVKKDEDVTIDQAYSERYVYNLLRSVMTPEEARRFALGGMHARHR